MNGPPTRVLSDEWESSSVTESKKISRVRFRRVASGLPLRPSKVVTVPFCPLVAPSSYGAVVAEQLTPTQQVAQWLKRTTSLDSCPRSLSAWSNATSPSANNMPSFRTLVKRSRSRAEMPRNDKPVVDASRKTSVGSHVVSMSEEDLEKELLSHAPSGFLVAESAGSPLKRDPSSKSLSSGYSGNNGKDPSSKSNVLSMRKCETVLALSNVDSASATTHVSVLSSHSKRCRNVGTSNHSRLNLLHRLAHSGSRGNIFGSKLSVLGFSSSATGEAMADSGFGSLAFNGLCGGTPRPLQAVNRLRVHASSQVCSRCSSHMSLASSKLSLGCAGEEEDPFVMCRICLMDVRARDMSEIQACRCWFCKECLKSYVEFEIQQGAYDISCPDPQCEKQGVITATETENLVGNDLMNKHNRFRLSQEVDLDACRTWCPRAGCETVCKMCPVERCAPQIVHCPTCANEFCSNCRKSWHSGITCEELVAQKRRSKGKGLGKRSSKVKSKGSESEDEGIPEEDDDDDDDNGIPEDSEVIKRCPACRVPIEKDAGCAQMMCKRCKHVFCWYCLESLDDDFLLRHYDKGPCKNKLGHSRASVLWHRTQVVGIFAGFGLLLLVASPLLLLAAPCILCCRCKICSKLDEELEESIASQQSQQAISAS